jgi:enamine deaminase RidA (YjgF/YER057c/UK114 family)
MSTTRSIVPVPGLGDSRGFGYEQCARLGNLVFVAGQTGVDENYAVVSPDIGPQSRQAFENVRRALVAAGSRLENLVTMTVFLTNIERDFHDFVQVRKELLGDALCPSAVIGVSQLALPTLLVEIQAIGYVSDA